MTDPTLFPLPAPIVESPDQGDSLSAGRRLTIRNKTLLARGVHPATRLGLIRRETCAGCVHLVRLTNGKRTYLKCENHRLGLSHSEASDVRASWPACTLFEPA